MIYLHFLVGIFPEDRNSCFLNTILNRYYFKRGSRQLMPTGPPPKEEVLENPVSKPTIAYTAEEAQSSKSQTFENVSQVKVTNPRGMIMYFCRYGRFLFEISLMTCYP